MIQQADILHFVQGWSSPVLDKLFVALSALGSEVFYLAVIPVLYWCVNKKTGYRLAVVFLLSVFGNNYLKMLFHTLRPSPDEFRVMAPESSYAFPSGHSQGSATFWVLLAQAARSRLLWAVAVILTLGVGISRLYLGVHWPVDVGGGWLIGLLFALVGWRVALSLEERVRLDFPVLQLLLAAGLPLLLLLIADDDSSLKIAGFLAGISAGYVLEEVALDFRPRARFTAQLIKVLIGLGVMVLILEGLKQVLPVASEFLVLRYAAAGFWGTFLAPVTFTWLLGGRR